MSRQEFARRAARVAAYLLQFAALVFVLVVVINSSDEIAAAELFAPARLWVYLLAVALLVGVIFFAILAYWYSLRSFFQDKAAKPPLLAAVQIYGRTILAKYIPGNVFHYLGRQVVGREFGLAQSSVARASGMEVLLLTSASSLVALVGINSVQLSLLHFLSYELSLWLLALGVVLPLVALAAINRGGGWLAKRYKFFWGVGLDIGDLVAAGLCYILYVLGNSLALIFLHHALIAPISPQLASAYFAVFSISFLVSYLTPGAPGGLGVREALFILLLGAHAPQSVATVVALAHRFASLGAQLAHAYLVAPLWGRLGRGAVRSADAGE